MAQKELVLLSIVGVAVLIVFIMIVVFLNITKSKKKKILTQQKETEKKLTIDTLIEIARDSNTTKNELFQCVKIVLESFPFPSKQKSTVTNEGRKYLNFISLVTSHKNSDAKLIAFMNTELKKKNPDYAREIELYEESGIRDRRFRK